MIDVPIETALSSSRNILLLGAGGGYDVLGAVPLMVALEDRGKGVFLGGISFSPLASLDGCTAEPAHACLYAVRPEAATPEAYCPEAWLARWLHETRRFRAPVWAIAKTGVKPLRAALRHLTDRLQIDTIVLVDGGVDLILAGDETSIGTPAEDLASLQAVNGLDELQRFIMCLGFGAELRDGIAHAQVLERIAALERLGGYLGATSLNPSTTAGQAYKEALDFVRNGQTKQRGTHIHRTVLSSMAGRFGPDGADVWLSPLTSICWFFSLPKVAGSHCFARHLEHTETIFDVTAAIRAFRKDMTIRGRTDIPL